MPLRPVHVTRWERTDIPEPGSYGAVPIGNALFHCWGADFEEFESGPGNTTVAIVEWPDGSIETVLPKFIRFLDTPADIKNTLPQPILGGAYQIAGQPNNRVAVLIERDAGELWSVVPEGQPVTKRWASFKIEEVAA